MGHDQSKNGPSLAEKRYKIERPPVKKRSKDKDGAPRIGKSSTLDGIKNADGCPQCPVIITTNDDSSMDTSMEKSDISNGRVSPSPHPPPTKKHFLSRRERLMIEQSWKKTRKTGAEHVGSKIFFMVLTAQPDIKSIFGLEKIPQGRLKYDPRFRQHATVFTKTFDYVIKNIEFPEKLETHFESLGRRHVVMQGRGFDPLYWETFAECMTQAAVEWEANRQRPTLGAWRTLVSTIIIYMRRGFDEENAKRRTCNLPGPRQPRRSSYTNNYTRSYTPRIM